MNDSAREPSVRWFSELGMDDLDQVGGKNASLGEMVANLTDLGVSVPDGFATTAEAFHRFLDDRGPRRPDREADRGARHRRHPRAGRGGQGGPRLDRRAGVPRRARGRDPGGLREAGERVRGARTEGEPSFAVRSSATAEDLPDASFAGQQETFLNVRGIDSILRAVREVYASLYNDRAIAYRVHHGFEHADVGISAGVQRMVRSDIASSGVMFTMDTESGFDDAVFITSAYGLGEGVVQGAVNPDEFYVYKPALRAKRPAILKRGIGSKATKMIYTDDAGGREDHGLRRRRRGRRAAVQPDRRRGRGARAARADHRGALRPADGHRVGQGRPRREALRPPGAAGDGAVAQGGARSSGSRSTGR